MYCIVGLQLMNNMNIHFISGINKVNPTQWQTLSESTCPFEQYNFLRNLENSQSVNAKQGWQPHHLVISNQDNVLAIMPMYIKSHSWGEYVFDWAWAEAYQEHNIDYYPKLVATCPFTPVNSKKLLSKELEITRLFNSLTEQCLQTNLNSWHILYTEKIAHPLPNNIYERNTVQFQWFNRNYESFKDFISTFTSRKRKNTLNERKSIKQQGLTIRQLTGNDITSDDLAFFYLTYQLTYFKKGHQPHLSYAFFQQCLENMANNMLLIIANNGEEDIASALFFYDDNQLYGRYWGCTKSYKNLHFELCYYRGIEFCIKNNIMRFNSGTQGEHKIKRGFEPVLTYSYHWIKHAHFRNAIYNFCKQEQQHMLMYQQRCSTLLPFKVKNNKTL